MKPTKRPIVLEFDLHAKIPASAAGPNYRVAAPPAVPSSLNFDPFTIGPDLGVHCLLHGCSSSKAGARHNHFHREPGSLPDTPTQYKKVFAYALKAG